MTILQTLRIAVRALARNKLRSFLTTLGIIIGVFAVIAMVAIGEGAKARVQQSFEAMGANLLTIQSGSSNRGGFAGGHGSAASLTWDDLKAIRAEAPAVLHAAAVLRASAQVQSEEGNWSTSVTGTSPEMFDIRAWPVALGAAFTDADVEGGTKVAVVGQTVVEKLWGAGADPVGQTMRVKNVPFQVVGVLSRKGQSAQGQDNDDAVFIPQTTFQQKVQGGLGKFLQGQILVSATASDTVAQAEAGITALLRDRHHVQPGAEDDFAIRNLTEMADAVEAQAQTLTLLLAAVAAVSLLVGGIGIMNIMLVSVTERTREIGVRMAVGARPRHILAQFLAEASALALAGGVIGVGLAVWASRLISSRFGWPMVFRPDIIVIAVGFSALVGVGFGLYPARKASRLDPIEALRYE